MSAKCVSILQSAYIPWKGYFDIINLADEFIFYEDVQYTKNDWRNRNLIKTSQGIQWLTIPVHGSTNILLKDTQVSNNLWPTKHWKTLTNYYSKAKFFKQYAEIFYNLYEHCKQENLLSKINYLFIKTICDILQINNKISWSMSYANKIEGIFDKTERVIALCKAAQATRYVSGPAGRNYIDETLFSKAGIELYYMNYDNYPLYHQLHGEFSHTVSIIDLIFNEGPNAKNLMKSFQRVANELIYC